MQKCVMVKSYKMSFIYKCDPEESNDVLVLNDNFGFSSFTC
jgi:hypothetical protein